MAFLSEKDRAALSEQLEKSLVEPVRVIYFEGAGCQFCKDVKALLEEVAGLSDKINLEIHDRDTEADLAEKWGVQNVPFIAVAPMEGDYGIRFTGAPFGYEFISLIEAIKMASTGESGLLDETKRQIAAVDKPVHIKVFVTPSCPYCPRAVVTAFQFAVENENVVGEMIEAQEFPEMATLYGVYAVPKIVINEKVEFEGAYPERDFLEHVLRAVQE